MADKKEELKKQIAELKEKISKLRAAGKESKKDPELRKLVKALKRVQRQHAELLKPSLEDDLKKTQKQMDIVGKMLSDMTKGAKKVMGDPYVHSLRKKTKSLNKRIKKVNRLIAKKAPKEAPAAAAAAPQA